MNFSCSSSRGPWRPRNKATKPSRDRQWEPSNGPKRRTCVIFAPYLGVIYLPVYITSFTRLIQKGPILRIGHHRLEGKLVPLPQPFAVIRKQDPPYNPEDEEDDENNGMDLDSETNTRRRRSGYGGLVGFTSSAPPSSTAVTVPTSPSKHIENGGKTTDYDVLTIIRYKYLFKNRPEISVSEELRGSNSLIGANRGKQ